MKTIKNLIILLLFTIVFTSCEDETQGTFAIDKSFIRGEMMGYELSPLNTIENGHSYFLSYEKSMFLTGDTVKFVKVNYETLFEVRVVENRRNKFYSLIDIKEPHKMPMFFITTGSAEYEPGDYLDIVNINSIRPERKYENNPNQLKMN